MKAHKQFFYILIRFIFTFLYNLKQHVLQDNLH